MQYVENKLENEAKQCWYQISVFEVPQCLALILEYFRKSTHPITSLLSSTPASSALKVSISAGVPLSCHWVKQGEHFENIYFIVSDNCIQSTWMEQKRDLICDDFRGQTIRKHHLGELSLSPAAQTTNLHPHTFKEISFVCLSSLIIAASLLIDSRRSGKKVRQWQAWCT